MKDLRDDIVRQSVRKVYGDIAKSDTAGCNCTASSGCDSGDKPTVQDISAKLGYSNEEVSGVPEGANMGLGCGNPQTIASLKAGETVVDLGSGGGFDSFLAAKAVGPEGRVIGVDMTAEMISKARKNAEKPEFDNVEFRLGEIEHLPVADNSADVIMSNCVINLSPDKSSVYKEAFRVLKHGGRLAISDIVATAEMPDEARQDLALFAGCVAGAALVDEIKAMLEDAGFTDIQIKTNESSRELIREWTQGKNFADYVVSATIEAIKPW